MTIPFVKYQGTGNDFILIDNRENILSHDKTWIQQWCDRHFGIGSDGLILIETSEEADFNMIFFNPDGSQSFCGNGSRCAVAYAYAIGITETDCTFKAIDGIHTGSVTGKDLVTVSVRDVNEVEIADDFHFIHTGSPHYMKYNEQLDQLDILPAAHEIRYGKRFSKEGTNVNFIEITNDGIKVRTYERGVENETLSCGSGVTACALSYALRSGQKDHCKVYTKGGILEVNYKMNGQQFTDIELTGPAKFVFKGECDV